MRRRKAHDGRLLFRNPAWRDWPIWSGTTAGVVAVYQDARSYFTAEQPRLAYFSQYDFVALVIDSFFGFGIAWLVFGVVPAALRRRAERLRYPLQPHLQESSKTNVALAVVPIIAVAASIFAAQLDAGNRFTDTTEADAARSARQAFQELSVEQQRAVARFNDLVTLWNQQSQKWVDVYMDPSLSVAETGRRAQPITEELAKIAAEFQIDIRTLEGTEASVVFADLAQHYVDKLDAIKGITLALALEDAAAEAKYGQRLADLNSRSKSIVCAMFQNLSQSRYSSGLSTVEQEQLKTLLTQCS
jgi:hypothetical protein